MSAVEERLINDLFAKVVVEKINVRDTIAEAFKLGREFEREKHEN